MREFPKDLRELLDLDTAEGLAKYLETQLPQMVPGIYDPYPSRNEAIEKRMVTFDYTAIKERVFANFGIKAKNIYPMITPFRKPSLVAKADRPLKRFSSEDIRKIRLPEIAKDFTYWDSRNPITVAALKFFDEAFAEKCLIDLEDKKKAIWSKLMEAGVWIRAETSYSDIDWDTFESIEWPVVNADMTSGGIGNTAWAGTIYAWEEEDGMSKKYKDKGPLWEPTEKTPRASALTKATSRKRASKVAAEDWLVDIGVPDLSGLLGYAITGRMSSQKSNIKPKASPDAVTESVPNGAKAEPTGFLKGMQMAIDEIAKTGTTSYDVFGNRIVTPSSATETPGEDVQKADKSAYGGSPVESWMAREMRMEEFDRERRLRGFSSSSAQPSVQMKAKIEAPARFRDPVLNREESGTLLTIQGSNYEVAITTVFRLAAELCVKRKGEATMTGESNYNNPMGVGAQLIFSARVSMTDMMLSVKDYFASLDKYPQTASSYTYIRKDDLLRAYLGRGAPVAQPLEPAAVAGQRAIVLEEE